MRCILDLNEPKLTDQLSHRTRMGSTQEFWKYVKLWNRWQICVTCHYKGHCARGLAKCQYAFNKPGNPGECRMGMHPSLLGKLLEALKRVGSQNTSEGSWRIRGISDHRSLLSCQQCNKKSSEIRLIKSLNTIWKWFFENCTWEDTDLKINTG